MSAEHAAMDLDWLLDPERLARVWRSPDDGPRGRSPDDGPRGRSPDGEPIAPDFGSRAPAIADASEHLEALEAALQGVVAEAGEDGPGAVLTAAAAAARDALEGGDMAGLLVALDALEDALDWVLAAGSSGG